MPDRNAYGIVKLDKAFVDTHSEWTNVKTHTILAVTRTYDGHPICPVDDAPKQDPKVSKVASVVADTMKCLGFAHTFDTEHAVKDIVAVWERTQARKNYASVVRLFNWRAKKEPSTWVKKDVVETIGMILRAAGLKLSVARSRPKTKGVRGIPQTTYTLDKESAVEMATLATLVYPSLGYGTGAQEKAVVSLRDLDRYSHLTGVNEALATRGYGFVDDE